MTDTYLPGTRRRHGTPSGYTGGCREACCADAMAAYQETYRLRRAAMDLGADLEVLGLEPIAEREYRARSKEAVAAPADDEEHGLRGYREGCKCPVCRAAGKAWADEYNFRAAIKNVI